MFYIFFILGLVYWILYKILSDFVWKSFFINWVPFFSNFKGAVIYSYIKYKSIYISLFYGYFIFYLNLENSYHFLGYTYFQAISSFYKRSNKNLFFFFVSGYRGLKQKDGVEPFEFDSDIFPIFYSFMLFIDEIYYASHETYFDFFLYHYTNEGTFFFDDDSNFLIVQNFRHSTKFEYVWASFPTVIIIFILIPSIFLLYSLDDDIDPVFTLKVIGHQWFWSYEYKNWIDLYGKLSDYRYIVT
jgi:hypothetical protein